MSSLSHHCNSETSKTTRCYKCTLFLINHIISSCPEFSMLPSIEFWRRLSSQTHQVRLFTGIHSNGCLQNNGTDSTIQFMPDMILLRQAEAELNWLIMLGCLVWSGLVQFLPSGHSFTIISQVSEADALNFICRYNNTSQSILENLIIMVVAMAMLISFGQNSVHFIIIMQKWDTLIFSVLK